MRRYDIVSGILLILSIIDVALAAPVLVQENCCADMVHTPKDETTMLGKRAFGTEELEEFIKSLEMPGERPDWHESSSSAPAGPDHAPPRLTQAGPEPPDHASPSSAPGQDYGNSLQIVKQLETGSSASADPEFDWEHWQKKVNEEDPPPGQPHDNLAQNVHQPETGSSAPADPDFDWEHWQKKVNEEDLQPVQPHDNPVQNVHQPETGSQAPDPNFDWEHWQKKVDKEDDSPPASRPPTDPHSNNWMGLKNVLSPLTNWVKNWANNLKPTISGSDPYMMGAHQPQFYSLSQKDRYDLYLPLAPTEFSYLYPESGMPGAGWRPTAPGHKVVTSPSPDIGSSPTDTQHRVVGPPSLDLEPLKEPENDVVKEPPTSPGDYPSSITNSQPVDPQALTQGLNYVLKGKAKVSDTTRGAWNADQSQFEPAERSLNSGE